MTTHVSMSTLSAIASGLESGSIEIEGLGGSAPSGVRLSPEPAAMSLDTEIKGSPAAVESASAWLCGSGSYTTPIFRNGKLGDGGRLILDLRDLAVPPAEVVRLVSTYWECPELRHELGQEAGVRRVLDGCDHRSGRT